MAPVAEEQRRRDVEGKLSKREADLEECEAELACDFFDVICVTRCVIRDVFFVFDVYAF